MNAPRFKHWLVRRDSGCPRRNRLMGNQARSNRSAFRITGLQILRSSRSRPSPTHACKRSQAWLRFLGLNTAPLPCGRRSVRGTGRGGPFLLMRQSDEPVDFDAPNVTARRQVPPDLAESNHALPYRGERSTSLRINRRAPSLFMGRQNAAGVPNPRSPKACCRR